MPRVTLIFRCKDANHSDEPCAGGSSMPCRRLDDTYMSCTAPRNACMVDKFYTEVPRAGQRTLNP